MRVRSATSAKRKVSNTKRANQGSSHTDTCRKVIPLGWRRSGAAVLVGQIGATPERQYAHGCMYAAEEIHDNDLRTPPTDDGKIKPMYGSTPKELFHAVHMDVSLAIDPTKSSPERVYTHRVPHKTRQEEKKKTTSWKTFLRG